MLTGIFRWLSTFKSHMVQIQLLLDMKADLEYLSLNPTWFRYNKRVEVLDYVKAQV